MLLEFVNVGGPTSLYQVHKVHFLLFWGPGRFGLKKRDPPHPRARADNVTFFYLFYMGATPSLTCWNEIRAGNGALGPLAHGCSVWSEADRQLVSTGPEVVWALLLTEPGNQQILVNLMALMFLNLFFPREMKSPFLPLQWALLCARSNFGHETTKDGQPLLFCIMKEFSMTFKTMGRLILSLLFHFLATSLAILCTAESVGQSLNTSIVLGIAFLMKTFLREREGPWP